MAKKRTKAAPALAYISLPDAGGTKEVEQKQINSDQQDRDEEMKMLDQIQTGLDNFYADPQMAKKRVRQRYLKTHAQVK